MAKDAPERGECRIVKRGGDRDTENDPGREISGWVYRHGQKREPQRANERPAGHDDVAAVTIDQSAGGRRAKSRHQQSERKAAHGERERPAALGRDQRHHQHRWIKQRGPCQDLRDTENDDRAPGAENEIAKFWHWWVRTTLEHDA
jgi:hypothetical protein